MQRAHLDALLQVLDADPERAAVGYRQLHQRLVRFFRLNNASDPEALADEALDRLARRTSAAPMEEIKFPESFAVGIARHLLQEDTRKQLRESEAAAEWVSFAAAHKGHREDLLHALEHCMAEMRQDQRQLLSSYYQWSGRDKIEHHRRVAEQLGVTLNTMRNRLMRARAILDKCIHKRCSDVFGGKDIKNERK